MCVCVFVILPGGPSMHIIPTWDPKAYTYFVHWIELLGSLGLGFRQLKRGV